MKYLEKSKSETVEFIERQHEEFRKGTTVTIKSLVASNISVDNLEIHHHSIRANYKSLRLKVQSNIQAQAEICAQSESIASREVQKLEEDISELTETEKALNEERKTLKVNYDWKKFPLIVLLQFGILCGEIGLNSINFSVTGTTVIASVPTAIAFAIILGALAAYVPLVIKSLPTPEERERAIGFFVLAMLGIFCVMGILRAVVQTGGDMHSILSPSTLISAVIFCVINMVMFIGMVLISVYALPTKEDYLTKRKLDSLNKKIKGVQKRRNQEEQQLARHKEDWKHAKNTSTILLSHHEYFTEYIESLCEQVVAEFIAECSISLKQHKQNQNQIL